MCSDLKQAVETWDTDLMNQAIHNAHDLQISAKTLVEEGLYPGMESISDWFDKGLIFLPQVLAASRVIDEAMKLIFPSGTAPEHYKGTVVMGTVSGDIHEIGKNICCAMLRGAGYNVIDLGTDVSPEEFADAAVINSADILGGSSLMTTTLVAQRHIVDTLRENKCEVITIFGGAPCTQKWVESIGGNCYSESGAKMVEIANDKMAEKKQR